VQIILQRRGSSLAEHEGQKLAGVSSRNRARSRAVGISEFTPEFTLLSSNEKTV
jgi:hypothetical protein